MCVDVFYYIDLTAGAFQAAQLALAAGARRRALATQAVLADNGKHPRPEATASTKVTPEAKLPRSTSSLDTEVEPRCLNFSMADASGASAK